MRLFLAIEIPEDVRAAIASLLREFHAIAPQVKWVRPESLHLTLKFLGETNPDQFDAIKHTLASIHFPQAVTLDFSGLGFFPDATRLRVLWTGVNSPANLQSIVTEIDRTMHGLGFPGEDRHFSPHLTLARISQPTLPPNLLAAIAKNSSRSFGSCMVSQFHLIESKLKSAGAEYTTLQSFSFVVEARR